MLDTSQQYFDTTDVDTMRRAYDAICVQLGLGINGDDAVRRDRIAALIANVAEPGDGDWQGMKQKVLRLLRSA